MAFCAIELCQAKPPAEPLTTRRKTALIVDVALAALLIISTHLLHTHHTTLLVYGSVTLLTLNTLKLLFHLNTAQKKIAELTDNLRNARAFTTPARPPKPSGNSIGDLNLGDFTGVT